MAAIPPDMVANLKVMARLYRERYALSVTERVILALPDHYFPIEAAVNDELEAVGIVAGRSSELGLFSPVE